VVKGGNAMSYTKTPLPGRIHPSDPEVFKAMFIRQGHAYVRGKRPDGSYVIRFWKRVRLRQSSNLQWNLATGYLNPDNWDVPVVSVDVAINPGSFPDD